MKRTLQITSVLLIFLWITPAFARDASEASMQDLREKIRTTDKQFFLEKNLKLTDEEGKAFWPIYEKYQKDLDNINKRSAMLNIYYANEYFKKSFTDKKAKNFIEDYLYIEKDLLELKKSNLKKLERILPKKKVVAYIQVEKKIEAIIQFEWAVLIPLAE